MYLYTRILALFSSLPYVPPTTDEIDLSAHLTNTSLQTDKGEQFVRLFDELVGCNILSATSDSQATLTTADLDDIKNQIGTLLGEAFNAALGMSVHFQVRLTFTDAAYFADVIHSLSRMFLSCSESTFSSLTTGSRRRLTSLMSAFLRSTRSQPSNSQVHG